MSSSWPEKALGDLLEITIGRTPPRQEPAYWTEDLERPFCTIADMKSRVVVPSREGVTEQAETDGVAKRVPEGSLMMSFKLTIGRMGWAGCDLFPNEAIAWLNGFSPGEIDEVYLALYLEQFDYSRLTGRAVKGNTMNKKSLQVVPVVLPPLPEQRRLADLVTRIDDVADALKRREATLKNLRSGVVRSVLSGAHSIPASYDRLTTDETD